MNIKIKNKKILIVDDEPMLREILAFDLEYLGAEVFEAAKVDDALELLEQNEIDLVISDIKMPEKDGVQLLKAMRAGRHLKIPVILITGFADYSEEDLFSFGANEVYNKPFDMDELVKSVERCFP